MTARKRLQPQLERRRAQRLTERILKFLRANRSWKFHYTNLKRSSKMRVLMREKDCLEGLIIFEWKVVLLDYGTQGISTAVHEICHLLFCRMKESEIQKMERLVMRHMTTETAMRIHLCVGKHLRPAPL